MQDLSAQIKLRKVSVILFIDLVFPILNSEIDFTHSTLMNCTYKYVLLFFL